jgi:hypothetical protein
MLLEEASTASNLNFNKITGSTTGNLGSKNPVPRNIIARRPAWRNSGGTDVSAP